jgi:hypothetical protein
MQHYVWQDGPELAVQQTGTWHRHCTDTPAAGAHLMCERMDLAGPGFGGHFGMKTFARALSDCRRLLAPVCDAHRLHAALHPRLPLQQG